MKVLTLKANNKYTVLFSLVLLVACSEIILEKNITNKTVVLLSPQDSTSLKTLTPSFWWEEVEGARTYHIQIVSPSFESPVRLFVDSIITKNKFEFDFIYSLKCLNILH